MLGTQGRREWQRCDGSYMYWIWIGCEGEATGIAPPEADCASGRGLFARQLEPFVGDGRMVRKRLETKRPGPLRAAAEERFGAVGASAESKKQHPGHGQLPLALSSSGPVAGWQWVGSGLAVGWIVGWQWANSGLAAVGPSRALARPRTLVPLGALPVPVARARR